MRRPDPFARVVGALALTGVVACAESPPPPVAPATPVVAAPVTPPVVVPSPEPPKAPEAPVLEVLPPPKPATMPLSQGSGSPLDVLLAKGDASLEAGDLLTALRSYEAARTLAPAAANPLVGLARVRIAKADVALDYAAGKGSSEILAARAMLMRASHLEPDSPVVAVELGRVQLLLGDAAAAMTSLRRAVALAPGEAEAHSVLGVALLATGHADTALAELRSAAALDMGSAARHGNLGTACLMNGDVPGAVKEYELQVRLDDGDARAHSDLGTALLAGGAPGDLARGIAELRRALTIEPSRATFHSNLGYALQLDGKLPEAIAEYRQAIALDAHLASAWINLATALAKDPKTRAEARAALYTAQKLDPTDPRVKANLNELDALEHGTTTP